MGAGNKGIGSWTDGWREGVVECCGVEMWWRVEFLKAHAEHLSINSPP